MTRQLRIFKTFLPNHLHKNFTVLITQEITQTIIKPDLQIMFMSLLTEHVNTVITNTVIL